MRKAVIIPARYGSSRFPGKPLATIAGVTMLARVCDVARRASGRGTPVVVATEDEGIAAHARSLGVTAILTPDDCRTGTDRVYHAARAMSEPPEVVVNLQGDAPLTPPAFVTALLDAFDDPATVVATPVVRLDWAALDALREAKATTPFSGTTAVVSEQGDALWFSKTIIPAIRDEAELRRRSPISPVHRHVGLYGYRFTALERFVRLPQGRYEQLEGLEQLRLIENGIPVRAVTVDPGDRPTMSGVDSPEDIARAEALLREIERAG